MINSELIYAFLSSSQTDKNLSQRTIKAYTYDLNLFDKFLKPKKIKDVNTSIIRKYLQVLQEKGLKSTSIKRKLATLKVFFSFLENEEIIDISPMHKLKGRFKIPRKLPRILSINEVSELLSILNKESQKYSGYKKYQWLRNQLIFELLFSTGIRIDELVKLKIEDYDRNNKTLLVYGKGRKERIIYISSNEVQNLISRHIILRNEIDTIHDFLFVNNRLTPLSVHSIRNIFKTILSKSSITKHYTPHCLRHTMATLLVENGADIRSVQEILGHSSISTTEIYVTISRQRKIEVMKKYNQRNLIMIC